MSKSDLPTGIFLRGLRKDLLYFRYQDETGVWRSDAANLVLPPIGNSQREEVLAMAKAAREEILRAIDRKRRIQTFGHAPGVTTIRSYAERTWLKRREVDFPTSWKDDEHHLRLHVYPYLGDRSLTAVTSADLYDFLGHLKRKDRLHLQKGEKKVWKSLKGDKLAPRTIRNIWGTTCALFRDAAVIERLIPVSPCLGLRDTGVVPEATDKDPLRANGLALSISDIEQLISDERVPEDRRVIYALDFLS